MPKEQLIMDEPKMSNSVFELPAVLGVDEEKCVNCHACIAACPVKYCNDGSGDSVKINSNLCIACGSCLKACTHEARYYIDDFEQLQHDLKQDNEIVAIVAPSLAANFPNNYYRVNTLLKKMGISAVFDVSFGAELSTKSYVNYIVEEKPDLVIAQPCPAIQTYIQLYRPELLKYLAPVDSPMLHTMKMIANYYPRWKNAKIAVISPCGAKKREYEQTGLGDYNIAYKTLEKYIEDHKIELIKLEETDYDNPPAERAVLFSSPGGLMRTVERYIPEIQNQTRKIEGVPKVYEYLDSLKNSVKEGWSPLLVDCLNCENGCNGGPFTSGYDKSPDELEYFVSKRAADAREKYNKSVGDHENIEQVLNKYWEPELYRRTYLNLWRNVQLEYPTEEQIEEIFHRMHKFEEKDIYNCTACGYGNCKDMAIAIHNGLNRSENCHFYLSSENEISKTEIDKGRKELRSILDTSIQGFLRIDKDRIIVDSNQAMKNMLQRQDLIGRSLLEFLDDVNKRILEQQIAQRQMHKGSSYELGMMRSDGTVINCLLSGTPIIEDNNMVGSFAMISDITVLKKAQAQLALHNKQLEERVKERTAELMETVEELRASTELIEEKNKQLEKLSIVASQTDNAVIISTPDGLLEWVNHAFLRMYDYTPAQIEPFVGHPVYKVSKSANLRQHIEKCLRENISINYETKVKKSNNEEFWVKTTLTPIHDDFGEISHLVAIDTDITELKAAEEQLQDANNELLNHTEELSSMVEELKVTQDIIEDYNKELEYLSAVANRSSNAIVILSKQGEYEWLNDSFVGLFGRDLHTIKQDSGTFIFDSNANEQTKNAVQQCIETQAPVLIECQELALDGGQLWVQHTLTPIMGEDDNLSKIIIISSDITNLKEAEAKLMAQKLETEKQRDLAHRQKQKVMSSINYASRIQQAILPVKEQLQQAFAESFVYNRPRDIVSGDFYWLASVRGLHYLAVADCTGHGVPGAFMSMLGTAYLNEIVHNRNIADPAKILDLLRDKIITSLHQKQQEGKSAMQDGMDIALCVVNKKAQEVSYAGANNSLLLMDMTEKTMRKLKCDKMPIGYYAGKPHDFKNNTVTYKPGDIIYLYSDGFKDQFGQIRNRKYLAKNFEKLLEDVSGLDMQHQEQKIDEAFLGWKGDEPQVDDVMVLGAKLM